MQDAGELVLTEAERDVRELEQHVADQHIRVKELQAAGREDDEMKAREGLFLRSLMPWSLRADVYRLSARHATSKAACRSLAGRRPPLAEAARGPGLGFLHFSPYPY